MNSEDTALRRLAARVGILPEYVDQTGETRSAHDETRRALLAALGFDADDEAAAQRTLDALDEHAQREVIDPVFVGRVFDERTHVLETRGHDGPWRLEIDLDDGEHVIETGETLGERLRLPRLPIGYHRLRLSCHEGGRTKEARQLRIVSPEHCVPPADLLGGDRAFGLTVNLYTVRSKSNWGVGDFTDLAVLANWAGEVGADFIGVNPLHALLNRGHDVSPYSPVTRLFRNPIYIDVMQVPELAHAPELRDRIASPEFRAELDALRDSDDVRYEQVMAVKGLVLTALHRVFLDRASQRPNPRAELYERFVEESDPALTRFATWITIAEREGSDWRNWPAELRDPDSEAVRRYAEEHHSRVEYHRWLQYEADRQLAQAATVARSAGMRIGLYQDLAIGSSLCGADTWAYPELFVRTVSLGAPPDPYALMGQNWGLPPIDPHALRRVGYDYFVQLLRNALRHAGALRIDHILGFFRQFWIPEGMRGEQGAYLRAPTEELFGILALESVRHSAVIVGEDLGTVPPGVPPVLERWQVLSSRVMFFERGENGSFRPPDEYPALALATADTHDMAPIAGFWSGRDIDIRVAVGLLDEDSADDARQWREHERGKLHERLVAEGVLHADGDYTPGELRAAVHALICRSPSVLVGLALDDLSGETEPVNVPGVGPDRFASWTRKMREPIEVITTSSETTLTIHCGERHRPTDG
jgi:4-alpha-glucanotransferase